MLLLSSMNREKTIDNCSEQIVYYILIMWMNGFKIWNATGTRIEYVLLLWIEQTLTYMTYDELAVLSATIQSNKFFDVFINCVHYIMCGFWMIRTMFWWFVSIIHELIKFLMQLFIEKCNECGFSIGFVRKFTLKRHF